MTKITVEVVAEDRKEAIRLLKRFVHEVEYNNADWFMVNNLSESGTTGNGVIEVQEVK